MHGAQRREDRQMTMWIALGISLWQGHREGVVPLLHRYRLPGDYVGVQPTGRLDPRIRLNVEDGLSKPQGQGE
jgi:hypothetical protein